MVCIPRSRTIPFLFLAAAYLLLLRLYPGLWPDLWRYLLFQTLFIILPGFCLVSLLIPRLTPRRSERLVFGYPVGIAYLFGAGLLSQWAHPALLYCLVLPVSAAAVFMLCKKPVTAALDREGDAAYGAVCAVVFAAAATLLFLLWLGNVSPPAPDRPGFFHRDVLWHLGTIWACSRGFPVVDARFDGLPTYYHLCQHMTHALAHRVTGADPFALLLLLDPLLVLFAIVYLVVYGGRRILSWSAWHALLFCFFLLFASEIVKPFSKLQAQLYVNPLTVYFSLPQFFLLFFLLIRSLSGCDRRQALCIGILFWGAAATKSLLLLIVPAAYIAVLLCRFVRGHRPGTAQLLAVILMIAGALLLKGVLYRDGGDRIALFAAPPGDTSLLPRHTLSALADKLHDPQPRIQRIVSAFAFRIGLFVLQPFVAVFLVCLLCSGRFRTQLVMPHRHTFMLAAAFVTVSLAIPSLINFGGDSVYFLWYARLAALFVPVAIADFLLRQRRGAALLLAGALLLAAIVPCGIFIRHCVHGQGPLGNDGTRDPRDSIDQGEWQAMRWIRQSTPPHAVFITDRRSYRRYDFPRETPSFFYYSALSGRQFWAEGSGHLFGRYTAIGEERWSRVTRFLAADDSATRQQLLREIPAQYFIQSRRFNHRDYAGTPGMEPVFANRSVVVYHLSRPSFPPPAGRS